MAVTVMSDWKDTYKNLVINLDFLLFYFYLKFLFMYNRWISGITTLLRWKKIWTIMVLQEKR